jgi:DDE family transposase
VKPGKARKLNYLGQLSVDTANHVITDIGAYHADKKDNQCLQDITLRLKSRLNRNGLLWHNLLADAGYSDGENYAFLEQIRIQSYIPPHGTYKGGPKGFTYDEENDHYLCPKGKIIPFKKIFFDHRTGTKKKEYRCASLVCKNCPIKAKCLGKNVHEKKFSVTYYRAEYERNNKRVKSKTGRKMKTLRCSTVEPVFGTLTQFMGMRKVNTIGIQQANKVMHMAAMAYILKKLLKFINKTAQTNKQRLITFLNRFF